MSLSRSKIRPSRSNGGGEAALDGQGYTRRVVLDRGVHVLLIDATGRPGRTAKAAEATRAGGSLWPLRSLDALTLRSGWAADTALERGCHDEPADGP